MPIVKIVSGGKTGADRGGMEAAIYCEISHDGWCPKGRKSEDGGIPAKYTLREMPSADYLARTEANVVDSDVTIIFTEKAATGGSLRTLEYCQKHGKPWHHISLGVVSRETAVKSIVAWLTSKEDQPDIEDYVEAPPANCILNVAGSRESKSPGIEDAVMRIMVDVLIAVNPGCLSFSPIPNHKRSNPE